VSNMSSGACLPKKPKGVRLMNFRGAKTGSVMQVKLARKIGQSCIRQSG
jgi:hypothetical protein